MERESSVTLAAAQRLHEYIVAHHWADQGLIGPDPGIRFNYRIGRFFKSYFSSIPWKDQYYYLQGQAYWILGNWRLFQLTGDERYGQIAIECSDTGLAHQRTDGGWDYPNPEWHGRTANAEGTWGSIGLLETYRNKSDPRFLSGALRWHAYLVDTIGFQTVKDELAANYFAHRKDSRVPNNSAFVLRFLAELAAITGENGYLAPGGGLLNFLEHAQKPTGEFPYSLEYSSSRKLWAHFQCYQYNAFQCLDLIRFFEITRNPQARKIIDQVLVFLKGGMAPDGHACYQCGNHYRAVTYHSAVLAAAFWKASQLGEAGLEEWADRGYSYVLNHQLPNGGFHYSHGDYRLFQDRRSYPRYLAMILFHLLLREPEPVHAVSPEQSHVEEN